MGFVEIVEDCQESAVDGLVVGTEAATPRVSETVDVEEVNGVVASGQDTGELVTPPPGNCRSGRSRG
jgi:hypothetical protein